MDKIEVTTNILGKIALDLQCLSLICSGMFFDLQQKYPLLMVSESVEVIYNDAIYSCCDAHFNRQLSNKTEYQYFMLQMSAQCFSISSVVDLLQLETTAVVNVTIMLLWSVIVLGYTCGLLPVT